MNATKVKFYMEILGPAGYNRPVNHLQPAHGRSIEDQKSNIIHSVRKPKLSGLILKLAFTEFLFGKQVGVYISSLLCAHQQQVFPLTDGVCERFELLLCKYMVKIQKQIQNVEFL